jgi:pyruvate dehydrogenase (quinone)/pyruvate oxidase
MVFLGNPEFGVELQPINFAEYARAAGGTGFRLEDPHHATHTVEQFLATPGPAILDAIVDPNEPPLPAKATADQALKFAESLARGEKDPGKILKNVLKDKVRELV